MDGVVEWLDRIPVTSSNEELRLGIIKTKRKLSTKMREEGQAVLLVQVNGDFGIALAAEIVAFPNKLFSDLVVPVELAVDHSVYIAICIMERLLSFGVQVNDSKTIVAES
jgi:hypothetical protein